MEKYSRHKINKNPYHIEHPWCLLPLFMTIGALFHSTNVYSEDYFNIHALETGTDSPENIDLSIFTQDDSPPGTYWVDIYLNKDKVNTRNVTFVMINNKLLPKLTIQQLQDMGVKIDTFPELVSLPPETELSDLGQYIPSASTAFNFSQQRLDISIPQAALNNQARGYVSPERWQQGLTSLLINYSYSGSNSWQDNKSGSKQTNYLNLRAGANWQAWRLRNYSTYTSRNKSWKSINTYLQRDIHSLKGQLTLGDSFTSAHIFEGNQFRGLQLASDDNMLPDSLKGFAPTVRGIAQSHAQVTIRQNGYIIYQAYVAPGPFVINDLFSTTSSGNLEVIIKEADGQERRSTQSFSTVPIMLREGGIQYSVTLGQYQSSNNRGREPNFTQSTLIYGLSNNLTTYGGTILSKDYQSIALGSGYNLGTLGSLSFDITHANTDLQSNTRTEGQSYRFQYAKDLSLTGTNFTLAGYRYSTRGFYDFKEANDIDNSNNSDWRYRTNKRSKLQLHVNQSLGNLGSLYLSAFQQNYWQQNSYERSINAGYSISYNNINYSLNYTYNQLPDTNKNEQLFSFSIQVPLDHWLKNSWAYYNLNTNKNKDISHQTGLSGSALEDNNLTYSLQQSYANHGTGVGGHAHAEYKGSYSQISAGYSYDRHSRQLNYGLQGGIVAHPYGITLSQHLGDTLALVRTDGAKGIKIHNNVGITTDWNGLAIIPYVSSYRKNRIALDTHSLADNVDIDVNAQTVIPTQGALVLANFQTRIGHRVLINLYYQNNPIPFGAIVTLEKHHEIDETNSAIVSHEGQVYLTGLADSGRLLVKWGYQDIQECGVNYKLPEKKPLSGIYIIEAHCK
ncbi:fimbria/pilus outer membrane usher protein [Photorhabdus heterorhabditis]|uniref:fimbria/pilus outer membrane usher protein n=1 Tax=Photorhabdus heterorhabditis TaxID=880156 RepID=UPI0015626E1B|nr:fimbria/pilus outer membrane usher protein [Photorhabdus heterorhabditis]NRN29834.1 fimbrial biogenesis outer membrane usher protein [Photorhabdus heterorhabditis subsp. aluminescens]